MNEATLFRKMIDGFEPKKIPKEFNDEMNKITEFITGLREHQLSTNEEILIKEISKWNIFQKQIYEKYMLIEGERDGCK